MEERLVSPHEHTAEIDYTHLEADSARPWTDDVRTHLDSFPLALPKDIVMWLAHNRGHGKTDFKRPVLTLRVAFMSRLRAAFLRHKRKIGAKQGKSCRIPEARNAT